MLRSEKTAIVPNALRQCLMALGGSEAGLRALAACNILAVVNALLAVGSEVGGLNWSLLPSGPIIGSRQMCSLSTVLLGLTCAVLPYIDNLSTETLLGIIVAANHEIEAGREGAQAHKEMKVLVAKLTRQCKSLFLECPQASETVTHIGAKAKRLLCNAAGSLEKVCGAPFCTQVESRSQKFQLCSGCRSVAYCCQDCQKSHWKGGHKDRCVGADLLERKHPPRIHLDSSLACGC